MTLLNKLAPFLRGGRLRVHLEDLDTTLVRGTAWAIGLNGGGLALGFLTQAILAHTLGVSSYGLYLTVLAWSNVAGLVCALEFANATVRYVSAYSATRDWGALRGFIRRSHQIVGITTITVAAMGSIAVLLLHNTLKPGTAFAYLIGCALFPLMSLLQLQSGTLLGWKRVRQSQAPIQVVRPAIFAVGVLLTAKWLGPAFEAADAVIVQFVATAITLSITCLYVIQATPVETVDVPPVYHTWEWIRTSSHFVAISMAQLVLSTQADLLFVSALLGTAQAGLYGAASQVAMVVGFGSSAIMVIAQPMIADLYARRHITELKKLTQQIMGLALIATVPVYLLIIALARPLLERFLPQFTAAYPVIVVLASSQLVGAVVGGLLGYLFTMTSHQQVATKVIGATAALNIVLALVLTKLFGTIGTASATTISTIVRSVALILCARRILREIAGDEAAAIAAASAAVQ